MNHSTPGLPVHHQLPEFTQTHPWIGRFSNAKMSVFPKLISRVHAMPVNIQAGFFCRKLQAERKDKRSRRAKTPWKMTGKVREFMFSSVQSLSCVRLFATPWITASQASLSITNSRSPPHSCPSSQWCHPAISSSVIPFSSGPQSLPASESFPMSQLIAWGGQSIGVSALASVLPKNTQDWSPLEWTGWISLQSKGLSRVFSNTYLTSNLIVKLQ